MTHPAYRIEGPALISFSGGRTSGYMLRQILDAHGGALPADVHVVFANTGKERPETLDFVRDCAAAWGVQVRWVEYRVLDNPEGKNAHNFCEVDYATASRDGEPFAALIRARSFVPNPVMRFCTQELKIRPMGKYARSIGFDHWTNVVGLRYDEPRRVAKATTPTRERWETVCPLSEARATIVDVGSFWRRQPFDLRLASHEGNCDLCFLKGQSKKIAILRNRPEAAEWWIEQERVGKFRATGPDYTMLLRKAHAANSQMEMVFPEATADDDLGDCACHD